MSDELFPFTRRFVDLDGNRAHYVDEGSSPVLLMLHGNPAWSFLYRHLITGLRPSLRCIALDYPGFGLSTARDGYPFRRADHARVVEVLTDALGLGQITFVVNDWGGPIGLWVAGRRPERVAGLVITNTFAWPVTGDRHFEVFSYLMGGPLRGVLTQRLNLFVSVLVPRGHRQHPLSPAEMARIFPDATTISVAGAGHFMADDAPDDMVKAIQGWARPEPR